MNRYNEMHTKCNDINVYSQNKTAHAQNTKVKNIAIFIFIPFCPVIMRSIASQ